MRANELQLRRLQAERAALVAAVRGCIAADLDTASGDDPTRANARQEARDLLVQLLLEHIEAVGAASERVGVAARPDESTRTST